MKIPQLILPIAATLAVIFMAGCSPDASDQTTAAKPSQPYMAVATQGKGFTVGAVMSANAVYVLFDPQCPHCGRLWQASVPLQGKVKFVWIPVSFINAKSGPQGAALLAAANPAELMAEHEKSILAGGGGISPIAGATVEIERAIKKNTQLFNSLGADSVPYILAKNIRTGEVVINNGALDTAGLALFLGIN
jgi:thiol:disulfide interchange protein DsbG